MVGQAGPNDRRPGVTFPTSPRSVGGANTQAIMLYVDDVDAHCSRARAAGASIFAEPEVHDYGADYWSDRSYGAVDPERSEERRVGKEGRSWWVRENGEDND